MSFIDEYNKALNEITSTNGNTGSARFLSGSTPNYFGTERKLSTTKKKRKDWKLVLDESASDKVSRDAYTVAERMESRAQDRKDDDEEEEEWFQKGAFEDGYDFGDITKTILGTGADILEDLGAGIAEMPEKIADAAAMIAPYYGQSQLTQAAYSTMNTDLLKSAKEYNLTEEKKKAGEWVAKDLYDGKEVAHSILNPVTDGVSAMIGQEYEKASVLGEKADSTVQSGGQLLGTMGLQAVGVPWFVTTGATSFGAEAENALNEGADHEEAIGSAAISAAAEILSEKLSGGISFGGKTLDDGLTDIISRAISNKLGRTAAKLGLDMAGEGAEEIFSQIASNLGSSLYKEEDITELLFSEEAFDEYLDSFIGGAALGGVSGGFNAVNSARKGVDYVTELTDNEQKVVDKVYKDRVAEAEKDGKVTEKKKSEIYDRVLSDMDKGFISTDTIEEVLGGDTYNAYKNIVDSEDAILKEYDELGEKENATPKDYARYTELTEQVKDINKNSQRNAFRSKLSEEVMGLVKSDRLAESYNEKTRRGQAYEADLTQYDAKQQAVIQKAVDSGILNNTNRTHEFVDMVAKISADKGVLFDFTNNAKLKDSGFAVEGKQVNGYVTKDGITLNIDSPKAMESTVGHEITHVMEGTEFYDTLKQTLFDYAKTKGDYQTRYDSLAEMYKDIQDANIDNELAADLVGDYLFNDTDFIKNLSTQNRNVFQKIYDEIKYLCKVVTAGSKEARELERVKKAFEDAYRVGGKAQSDTKYSVSDKNIKDISTGYSYGETYYTMSYTQDGKTVGTLEYGEYDGEANVKMIRVEPEYRRKGIATKLMQELQNKYPDTEINFGMSTPDGTKLLESITYDVTDEAVVADRQKLKNLQAELNELQEKLDVLYDTENLTEEQDAELHKLGDRWQDVYESIHYLTEELRGKKATRTFVKTDAKYSLSEQETQETNEKLGSVGMQYDSNSGTVSYSLSSLEDAFDYNKGETEYQASREEYASALAKATGKTLEEADRYLNSMFLVHDMIAADRNRLDYESAPNKSAWVSNAEYGGSIDFSTLCAKRRLFTGTFDAIQNALPDTVLNDTDFLNIRNLLLESGQESPCSMCYVEGSRAKHGVYVSKFLKEYLKTNPEWKPQIADFASTTRLEQTRIQHPEAYAEYQKAMNKLSQRKPKEASVRTDYKGEILRDFKDTSTVAEKNKNGGVRFNSFSDFEIIHAIDCMQVLTDMSRVGLNGQAYTKVKEFAEAFGNTGLKINLSLVAKGVDTNGKLVMDETNGMNYAEAMDIRSRYSDNVGTVIVVFNDRQLMAALADDTIDYVLPFHRSQWKKSQYELMGLPNTTRDYTNIQNDRYKNPKTGRAKKAPTGNIMPNEYWDFSLSGRENAQKYLDYINENNYIPKFDFLLKRIDGDWVLPEGAVGDGYFKLLIDFKMYNNDGVGSPQMPVLPEFNMPYIQEMLDNYVGGHQAFPVAHDVVDKFVKGKKNGDYSLSDVGEQHTPNSLSALRLETDDIAPVAENATAEDSTDVPVTQEAPIYESNDETAPDGQTAMFEPVEETSQRTTRKELHQNIIDSIIDRFDEKGFDFDTVLKKAKDLSTWSTVDNTPQRVMEKALGYKEGGILADITVNKVAQNESEGIKWINENVKVLKEISKQYHIKPGSKESAAAQMYAEGFFVNENNEIVRYGEPELIQDFKNPEVRRNIKALASDPRIRKIYDDTLASINESRTRNAYPEIPRLDNYFLHFRAMNDTFSTLGFPFNPNDIRAKDLPTDLNGVTADLKPGQPYFSSAMHRTGKRTSFDMLGGIERYLNSAKNQIYHIDDIQTLRALRNYIAETYGQATGLEDIDSMTDAEAEERIKQVYGSHLSTFAKFLNEEANVLAGKTALIDRGAEGIFGRRAMTFMNTLNSQVGSNMVGYNISSSLTNFLPVAQTFAKTNKFDFTKAFAQTVANKFSGGKFDSFAEDSPVVIRRKGSDRFYQTSWQKMQNPGYVLMSAVDDISTELIARTKYNEFTRKGMDSQTAHFETDKWVSRLMGDRSLGQQPQLYNSKMLGLVTKFQLEVRNQLDAQFYDTIQETKVSNEHIQNGLLRNAKTAAQVASTFTQLAVAQHLFGKAFESVAGYNPAFDIIEVLMTAFGYDDDEESEDTALDNLEQGFFALLEDLPYASTFTGGGRIPISSALPIGELVRGEDQYGNDKSRWETVSEIAPYYLMPAGYGQIKKTAAGLEMFSDEHPIAGSYTEAGNLRFPVDDTLTSKVQAGIFGQYASENARKYFDEEQRTLNPEQTEIFAGLDIPIEEYWEYRDNLYEFYDVKDQLKDAAYADGATDEDDLKYRYISSVYNELYDLYDQQKEIASGDTLTKKTQLRDIQTKMSNMLTDSKSAVDSISISGAYGEVGDRRYNYDAEKDTWYEIKAKNSDGSDNWYYQKEQEVTKGLGISYEEYWNNREEYNYAYDKPGKYAIAQAVGGYDTYMEYYDALENWQSDTYISADKDEYGNSISGSRKKKVQEYINGLDIDYGEKIILYRTVYSSKSDKKAYNKEIVNYLNSRDDVSYEKMKSILEELDMEVDDEGKVSW